MSIQERTALLDCIWDVVYLPQDPECLAELACAAQIRSVYTMYVVKHQGSNPTKFLAFLAHAIDLN